jgi:hypothetical protein
VPITTSSGTGSSANVTIRGFITVYINSWCGGTGCNGQGNSPACVIVTPVKSNVYVSGIAFGGGGLSSTNPVRVIKLIN